MNKTASVLSSLKILSQTHAHVVSPLCVRQLADVENSLNQHSRCCVQPHPICTFASPVSANAFPLATAQCQLPTPHEPTETKWSTRCHKQARARAHTHTHTHTHTQRSDLKILNSKKSNLVNISKANTTWIISTSQLVLIVEVCLFKYLNEIN